MGRCSCAHDVRRLHVQEPRVLRAKSGLVFKLLQDDDSVRVRLLHLRLLQRQPVHIPLPLRKAGAIWGAVIHNLDCWILGERCRERERGAWAGVMLSRQRLVVYL